MKDWTEGELLGLAKKKLNIDGLKDGNVVLHPEISKWRSPEKPDLQLLRSLNRGQIQTIVFRDLGEKGIQLLAGSRRYFHLKLLGRTWDEIMTDVRENVPDKEALILSLSENFYRKDMTPMEEARAINSMLKMRMTIKTISKTFDKSEVWVRSRKSLYELPEKVRDTFEAKEIDFGYSIPLRKLKGMEEAQAALLEEIIEGRENQYQGIRTIEKADEFVTRVLKQKKDLEDLLAKYGPCTKCGSKNIREGYGEERLVCKDCDHSWHGETKEPWAYYELKQQAQEMGFEIEEGPETLKLTPKDVAKMIEQKAAEEKATKAEEEVPKNFRCKPTLLMLLEPMIAGDNIQKLVVRDEAIEIQLIEGKDLHFNGLRKDYVDGINKARIETTGWSGQDSVKRNHEYIDGLGE